MLQVKLFWLTWSRYPLQKAVEQGLVLQVIDKRQTNVKK